MVIKQKQVPDNFNLYVVLYQRHFPGKPFSRQLVSINPENGKETLIATINETGDKVEDAVYLPATNEIIGRDEFGAKLIKVNVTTKQVSAVTLTTSDYIGYNEMVVDKSGNLYAIKHDFTDQNHYIQTLVKLDPQTGAATAIKGFESYSEWGSLGIPAGEQRSGGII